ncbi:UDP-N-acetylglucosamine--N-acetylmuramyl-(pentapeptide) pyrophosphoryl-undecaprenol N-acetylglucosamine transferase [Arcanobacterium hippocoleae]
MANKFGARMANTVALSFKNTPLRAKHGETVVTGLPLRKQISELALMKKNPQIRNQNAQKYGLDSDLPILVVTGGSLGAQHINEVVAQCAQEILDSGFQVLHICGKGKIDEVQAQTAQVRGTYQVLEYAANIDEIYSFADLVITRAGAGMVCEVSALGIPAVFVPLAVGNGEQALNAKDLVEAGGAILIPDNEFNTDVLREKVLPLLALEKLTAMASKARAAARIDAAAQLAAVILQ